MKKLNLLLAALGMITLMSSTYTQADLIIFDEANGTGWSRPWYTPTQATDVNNGTTALQTSNGQFEFNHAGLVDSENYILEFYVNSKDTTPGTSLFIRLDYVLADTTVENDIPFDNRNIPVTYVIDNVDVLAGTSGKGVATDGDTGTWQKFQVDLSQTTYTGFPYESHTYVPGSSTLTQIVLRNDGGQSANLVLDDVRLISIPEPSSLMLVVLSLSFLPLFLRHRR